MVLLAALEVGGRGLVLPQQLRIALADLGRVEPLVVALAEAREIDPVLERLALALHLDDLGLIPCPLVVASLAERACSPHGRRVVAHKQRLKKRLTFS
eukprot:6363640-Prymnesium_polylepis.1